MNSSMDFEQLVNLCQQTHEEMCVRAARVVDSHLVVRNWLFGHYISEFEQKGADRAEYGVRLLGSLADRFKPLKIKGTSVTRLKLYRSFYRLYPISPTVSDLSLPEGLQSQQPISGSLMQRFPLGWSHYVELLTLDDTAERRFYEIGAADLIKNPLVLEFLGLEVRVY